MNVTCHRNGSLTIHATAHEAALLAGRSDLGDVASVRRELEEHIRQAWYAADCPPTDDSLPEGVGSVASATSPTSSGSEESNHSLGGPDSRSAGYSSLHSLAQEGSSERRRSLSDNERYLAKIAFQRGGDEARRWGNLVFEGYDAVESALHELLGAVDDARRRHAAGDAAALESNMLRATRAQAVSVLVGRGL